MACFLVSWRQSRFLYWLNRSNSPVLAKVNLVPNAFHHRPTLGGEKPWERDCAKVRLAVFTENEFSRQHDLGARFKNEDAL